MKIQHLCLLLLFVAVSFMTAIGMASAGGRQLFHDDFEKGLGQWELLSFPDIAIRPSNQEGHNNVLVLIPNGDVYALMKRSDRWHGIRMEADVLFPNNESNYLGIIYNLQRRNGRTEFGNIYIKGDGSYLQVNPHRDLNVGRTLYPEYHVTLKGAAAIRTGEWQHIKVEVIRNDCHFFVGDMQTPQLTFGLLDLNGGSFGLQPRSVGGEVWVDNVTVHSIEKFSYGGPPRPSVLYETAPLLTAWSVVGPLERTEDEIARNPDSKRISWRPFPVDQRGAVITGSVTDYHGPRTVAYFRTKFQHDKDEEMILHLSTVDDLALWINGRFQWFIPRGENAWFDFWNTAKHAGQRIPLPVKKGENQIVIRVRGGVYASGGFYARLENIDQESR